MSAAIIPFLAVCVLLYAACKRVNIYESFVSGAQEALPVLYKILPYMAAMLISIQLIRVSGIMDMLIILLEKPLQSMGVPPELLPVIVFRPLSGSASMAIIADIFENYGADSFVGMAAATMMGSTETIFYTIALYYGCVGVKKTRFTLPVALLASLVSVVSSIMICRLLFT